MEFDGISLLISVYSAWTIIYGAQVIGTSKDGLFWWDFISFHREEEIVLEVSLNTQFFGAFITETDFKKI